MPESRVNFRHLQSAILTRWKSEVRILYRPPFNHFKKLGCFRGKFFTANSPKNSQQNRNKIYGRAIIALTFLVIFSAEPARAEEEKLNQWVKNYFTIECKALHLFEQPKLLLTFTPGDWDKPSQWIGGAYVVCQVLDYAQTMQILRDGRESSQAIQTMYDRFGDAGPLMYFITVTGVNLWIADKLPPWARTIYLMVDLGGASDAVRWNLKCGYKL